MNITRLKTIQFLIVGIFCLNSNVHAITSEQLVQLIECKATSQHYIDFGLNFEQQLRQLGWIKTENTNSPVSYLYKNTQNIKPFGRPTHEIALVGNAILAKYRTIQVNDLAKEFNITLNSEDPVSNDYFSVRGSKLVHTETSTIDRFGYELRLNLLQTYSPNYSVLFGCSYEPNQQELDEFLEQSIADL